MNHSITYETTRLASGLIRVNGEITFGDGHTRKIVLTIDPPKLITRLFDRAARQQCRQERDSWPCGSAKRAERPSRGGSMANMKILGPAKKLLRVRQQEGHLKRVQPGRGETVHVTIELTEDGRRIELEFDRQA